MFQYSIANLRSLCPDQLTKHLNERAAEGWLFVALDSADNYVFRKISDILETEEQILFGAAMFELYMLRDAIHDAPWSKDDDGRSVKWVCFADEVITRVRALVNAAAGT